LGLVLNFNLLFTLTIRELENVSCFFASSSLQINLLLCKTAVSGHGSHRLERIGQRPQSDSKEAFDFTFSDAVPLNLKGDASSSRLGPDPLQSPAGAISFERKV